MVIKNGLIIKKGLAVAVAAGGLINDHDLNEYRLATKRYHRKIRSSKEGNEFVPFDGVQQTFVQQPDELPIFQQNTSGDESVNSAAPNTSFLLDLPYPSHFLVSLQMLNLSLPFIESGIPIPEDPPTPKFDLDQVIKNKQFQTPKPEENQGDASVSSVGDGSGGRRRAINRKRHRIPVRRLPKRSADVASVPTIGKPVKFRNWNASNPSSVQRRQEFTNKLRSTTTQRPTFIKKFQAKQLNRRANTTKLDIQKRPSHSSPESNILKSLPVKLPVRDLEQSGASTEQREFSHFNRPSASGTSDRLVFHSTDNPSRKTRIGGFRPIQLNKPSFSPNRLGPSGPGSESLTPKFINGHSDQFIPIIPETRDTTTAATTEIVAHYDFPPPSRLRFSASSTTTSNPLPKPGRLSKYISQFHSSSSSLKSPSEEITQIQKPDTAVNEANREIVASGNSNSNEFLIFATTTTDKALTEFVPNLKFPSFELPSIDGSSTPTTLPPPLSIEELIKKFTGKDFIADSSSVSSTPSPPQHPSPIQPKSISSTTTTVKSTISIPELESLDDLEASLKKLLVVTTSAAQVHNNNESFISLDAPTTSSPSTSTPSESSLTLQHFHPVLPPPSVNPVTEKTVFPQQETATIQTTTTKEILLPSESEVNKSAPQPTNVVNSSSSLETSHQPVSVQRGPLDVSSFDGSFSSGVGQHQGGFNFQPSSFPQQQQQQFQSNNFGGFSGNFGGGGGNSGDLIGGQQNPYYYGAGLFTGSGGQGQFSNFQNGFDGTLHYSPTGPPVGESNAITQGLSLLASFGGSGGGHQQFNLPSSSYQQPAGYQQSFNDFVHPSASLQASSQIQTTSQGFSPYSQGYPSFNLVQQQPQSYAQSQSTYQFSQQPQNYPSQQQQQLYAPAQQQSYQLVGGANSGSGLYPVQVIQLQPQGVAYQSTGSASPAAENSGSNQVTINPSQFGTLLSGSPSVDSSGLTAGTASITSLSSSSSSSTDIGTGSSGTNTVQTTKEKSIDAASSQLVEIHLKPVLHSIFADQEAETSHSIQLISVGPETDKFNPATNSLKTGARKSLYNRGLRSGYYS